MLLIQGLIEAPWQRKAQVLPDGSIVTLILYFIPMQQSWFIQELTYGDFILRNIRITTYPNILYQWRNILPFGIACHTIDFRNPSFQEDFSSGASKLYFLTETEVTEFTSLLNG